MKSSRLNRIISMTLTLALMLGLYVPVRAYAVASGTCGADGDNLTWTLDSDGTLTVSGTGAMADWEYRVDPPWGEYTAEIKTVVIQNGVTNIGNFAFPRIWDSSHMLQEFAIKEIRFSESVAEIGWEAFRGCGNLSQITVAPNNSVYQSIDGVLFSEDGSELIFYPTGKECATYRIPDGVNKIESQAFDCVWQLEHIEMPDSVWYIHPEAFWDLYNLMEFRVDSGNNSFQSIDGVLFSRDGQRLYLYPARKEGTAYSVPNGVREIAESAFMDNWYLESIELPNGVTDIGRYAFEGCQKLTTISIPASVTAIDDRAFAYATALNDIYFGGTEEQWEALANFENLEWVYDYFDLGLDESVTIHYAGNTVIASGECGKYGDNLTWTLDGAGRLTISGEGIMADWDPYNEEYAPWYYWHYNDLDCYGSDYIKTVIIEEGVTSIGNYAFYDCGSITSVTISSGVTEIGNYAFASCSAMTSVKIPSSVTVIGECAFSGCSDLTIYCFPESTAEQYAIDNEIPYVLNYATQAKVAVFAGENAINSGYTVSWYAAESGEPIARGNILHGAEYGKEYTIVVSLDEELGCVYKEPDRITMIPTEENSSVEITLVPYSSVTVSGTVTDEHSTPIAGASIRLEQTFGDKYSRTVTAETGTYGQFSITVKNAPTKAVISAEGYYSRSKALVTSEASGSEVSMDMVSLIRLPENKITLSLYEVKAVKPSEEAVSLPVLSTNNLTFTLFNKTQNRKIENFAVQYPNLVLGDNEADGGDVIEIKVTDNKDQMTSDGCEVTLDSQKIGTAEIVFAENGKVCVNSIMGIGNVTVMLFDGDGRFIKSETAGMSYTSDSLAKGTYSLLFIKKTDLLRCVASISKLSGLGLSEGTDYIVKTFRIENGEIAEIDSVTVPQLDERRLYYTVSENTNFSASFSSVSVGRYVTMRCEYEIDGRYSSSGEQVSIELPENVSFTDGSLTLDGKIAPYTLSGNTLTVHTGRAKGVIRFYVVATDKGECRFNAYLTFANGGNPVTQPIGTAAFTAEAGKISVPQKTGQKRVTVTGTTLPKSKITLYDNDTEVGTTTANANGTWSIAFELVKPYSYSFHDIYAEIENAKFGGKAVSTDTETLLYDISFIELSKITMINTGDSGQNVSVFDFLTPGKTPSYRFWPGRYPKFTFKVEFTGGDDTVLSDVYVVTTNSNGEKTYVECKYDSSTGMWLGTHDYNSSSDAPVSVSAVYNNNSISSGCLLDMEGFNDYLASTYDIINSVSGALFETVEFGDISITENYIKYDVLCEGSKVAQYKIEVLAYSEANLSFFEDCYGYVELEEAGGAKIYCASDRDINTFCTYYIDETEQLYIKESLKYINTDENNNNRDLRLLAFSENEIVDLWNLAGSLIPNPWAQATSALLNYGSDIYIHGKMIVDYAKIMEGELKTIEKILNMTCANGEYKLSRNKRMLYRTQIDILCRDKDYFVENATNLLVGYMETAGLLDVLLSKGFDTVGKQFGKQLAENANLKKAYRFYQKKVLGESGKGRLSNKAKDLIGIWAGEIESAGEASIGVAGGLISSSVGNTLSLFNLQAYFGAYLNNFCDKANKLRNDMIADYDKCENPPTPKDPAERRSNEQPTKPILDPSGYVYEAVPSNRVEGVKAEAYYYDFALDEFGVPEDNKSEILWYAEDYDQINPLYTDKNGMYAWDVPMGQWLVKFSKDGYLDTDSKNDAAVDSDGYLPVPPPQTEVNTAIVSTEAPTVKNVNVYSDEVQIVFSQYMQIDTVSTANVTVNCGGEIVSGTIVPENAEDNYEKTAQYASIFAFKPDTGIWGDTTVTVQNVRNYVGTAMSQKYAQIHYAEIQPESISISDTIDVTYNSGALLEIQILPAKSGAGKKMTVYSSSPSIVAAVNSQITADENGKATVMLSGNLPGEGEITVALDGTPLVATTRASVGNVVEQTNVCKKVTASIANGSVVERGTMVTLSTETEGAEIYYTLDGTCPCIIDSPSRIKYFDPIEINAYTFIIAYAVKDGFEESNTNGFVYDVADLPAISAELSDQTLRCTVSGSANMDAMLIVARYDKGGQMLGFQMIDAVPVGLTVLPVESAWRYRVFLTERGSMIPLADAWDSQSE